MRLLPHCSTTRFQYVPYAFSVPAETAVAICGTNSANVGTDAPAFPVWTRVPGATVTGQTNQPLPPIAMPADAGRFRVVVREVEHLPSTTARLVDAVNELTERTVYLDIVSMPIA
jgi:hypothetical protein